MTQESKQQPEDRDQADSSMSPEQAQPAGAPAESPAESGIGETPAEAGSAVASETGSESCDAPSEEADPGASEGGVPSEGAESPEGDASSEEGASPEDDQDEPFGPSPDDIADLVEVIARDERSATLPPRGTSSVETALEQRPPRLAKAKRGPRTAMLEQVIPEVVIPTDAFATQGFHKITVLEASELEKLRAAARAEEAEASQDASAEGEAACAAETAEGEAFGDSAEGVSGESAEETSKDSAEDGGENASGRQAGVVVREGVARRTDRKKDKKPAITSFHVVMGAVLLVLVCVLGASGAFVWDRWYRYDDALDMRGEWKMANAERTMVITENTIKIAEGVEYEYSLDTKEKTITYSFGKAKATASYRFGDDRKSLVIDESCKTDWLVALHLKDDPVLESRDVPKGVSKLSKLSNDTEAQPKDTEEIRADENALSGGTWVDGYFDYKRPKIETAEERAKAEEAAKKKKEQELNGGRGEDDEDSQDSTEHEDGAAYVDEETGNRYYYDATQMLYYDLAGNYYYDMYGNNPYEPYTGSY